MIHIGIDVGLTGAIAAIDAAGRARVADLVTIESNAGGRLNGRALILLLREFCPHPHVGTVIVEDVRARPDDSKGHGNTMYSQASLMRSRGIVECACDIAGLPIIWVQPQSWKKRFGLLKKDKDESRQVALRLMPALAAELKRKKDHNRAEALLLARYGISLGETDQRDRGVDLVAGMGDGVPRAPRAGAADQEGEAGLAF